MIFWSQRNSFALICLFLGFVLPPAVQAKWTRNDMLKSVNALKNVMQMRLTKQNIASYLESPAELANILASIRTILPKVLACDRDDILLYSILDGSAIVQFTVYDGSGDTKKYEDKWVSAVKAKNEDLAKEFADMDFSFEPTGIPQHSVPPHTTTTTTTTTTTSHTPESSPDTNPVGPSTGLPPSPPQPTEAGGSGTKPGVVAGAVIGGVAALALLGGGATVAYRRKMKRDAANRGNQDFDGNSPGASTLSPHGLANIGIHGEATPNPHNFRPSAAS